VSDTSNNDTPAKIGDKRTVPYHGPDWMWMVESGWITWTVDEDGKAVMLKVR
jgi:hypothetical protein